MKIEVTIIEEAICLNRYAAAHCSETGAIVSFQGVVRQSENGQPIKGLYYEAYRPMAEKKIREILLELAQAHPCQAITVVHRTGWVPVGECSLYIEIAASHRKKALALCSDFIDRLKQDVPIWKNQQPSVT